MRRSLGCSTGGVPVPVYPPFRRAQVEDHLRRQATILRNAGASFLIIGAEIRTVGQLMLGLAEDLRHMATVKELSHTGAIEQPSRPAPDTVRSSGARPAAPATPGCGYPRKPLANVAVSERHSLRAPRMSP